MRLTRNSSSRARRAVSPGAWFESPWRIVGRAITSAVALVAIIVLLGLVVIPRLLGGDSLTVLSGSMEPTFSPGDVVVVKGIDEAAICTDITVGSIVTFFPTPNDPTLITHRVVGKTIGTFDDGTNCRLITQGDANSAIDEPISPAQVRGVFMYGVPKLGWARQWVGDNLMLVSFGAVAALVAWGIWGSFRKPKTTVMRVPRPAGSAQAVPKVAQADPTPIRDRELVEKEFQLRERELELRERELAFAIQRSSSSDDPVPRVEPDSSLDDAPQLTSEFFSGAPDGMPPGIAPASPRNEA